jgi:hypothetical protein
METIRLFIGYDPREAAAYHVFCQSVIERASRPVAFYPLHKGMLNNFDGQRDGTNAFIFSRYLVPFLCSYKGQAIFMDGDMVCLDDIAKLWDLRNEQYFNKAVSVVKHDYKTKFNRKYIGTPIENDNVDYPRKNWSSVMLWNCGHYANQLLTPEYVSEASGQLLHRFDWLKDEQIGDLPSEWNRLACEQASADAKLIHYTLGIPGIPHYAECDGSEYWHDAKRRAMHIIGG